MITYLQEHIEGTVGKHSDHFKLYLDTEVIFDERIMKWVVTSTVWLKVIDWCCIGNPIFILTVDGEDKANHIWLHEKAFVTDEYVLGSFMNFYSASFTDTEVPIYASFILEANEKGPGTCVVESTIKLPSVLNANGIMLVDNAGASNVVLRVVNLPKTLGYVRVLEFYYKKSTDKDYTFIDREIIMSSIESFTRYINNLIPGVSYDFKCVISVISGEHLTTLKRSFVTSLKLPRLDTLYRTSSEIMLKVSELESVVNYNRVLQIRYRVKGSLDWATPEDQVVEIYANDVANNYIFDFETLESGTNYEFELRCSSDGTTIFSKSIFSSTLSDDEVEDNFLIINNASGNLEVTIKNSKLNAGNKNMAVYVQDTATKKYHYVDCYSSTYYKTGYSFSVTPDVSSEIKALLSGENPTFKLIFSDQTTNIIEDIRYVVGG